MTIRRLIDRNYTEIINSWRSPRLGRIRKRGTWPEVGRYRFVAIGKHNSPTNEPTSRSVFHWKEEEGGRRRDDRLDKPLDEGTPVAVDEMIKRKKRNLARPDVRA